MPARGKASAASGEHHGTGDDPPTHTDPDFPPIVAGCEGCLVSGQPPQLGRFGSPPALPQSANKAALSRIRSMQVTKHSFPTRFGASDSSIIFRG